MSAAHGTVDSSCFRRNGKPSDQPHRCGTPGYWAVRSENRDKLDGVAASTRSRLDEVTASTRTEWTERAPALLVLQNANVWLDDESRVDRYFI